MAEPDLALGSVPFLLPMFHGWLLALLSRWDGSNVLVVLEQLQFRLEDTEMSDRVLGA